MSVSSSAARCAGSALGRVAGALWFALEAIGNSARGRRVVPAPILRAIAPARRRARRGRGRRARRAPAARRRPARRSRWAWPTGSCASSRRRAWAPRRSTCWSPPCWSSVRCASRAATAAGVLAFLHATLLGAAGGARPRDASLDSAARPRAARPAPADRDRGGAARSRSLADWMLGLVIRRRGLRARHRSAAAVLVACVVLGKPLSTAPLESRVVTGGAAAGRHARTSSWSRSTRRAPTTCRSTATGGRRRPNLEALGGRRARSSRRRARRRAGRCPATRRC